MSSSSRIALVGATVIATDGGATIEDATVLVDGSPLFLGRPAR